MYSNLESVQIIVSLLKQYEISHIVISPGTRHTPLVHSIENDSFFNCYSIVDERSASFFALGLIQELQNPVAICCTSGTASCNYVSAVNEAFFQQLPLLVLTADRNPYYLFQQEEQMVPQQNLFADVCKKAVTLPIVKDEKDFWYCSRLVNEALLELNHRQPGPVHINFPVENDYPIYQGIVKFDVKHLPKVKKIDRLSFADDTQKWVKWSETLKNSKVLVIYGQHGPLRSGEQRYIEEFCRKYDCVISVDHLSNLHCEYGIDTYFLMKTLSSDEKRTLCPDIVVTMNGSSISEIKGYLAHMKGNFSHWHVSAEGLVSDPFECLPDVVECSPLDFFRKFAELGGDPIPSHSYYCQWKEHLDNLAIDGGPLHCEIEYSALYATQQLVKNIPQNSLLHLANSNSVRNASFFPLPEGVTVYCNRGTNGIDGSMSAFIGQAHISNRPSFLLIGDLSFFYDMNALWSRYIGSNIRILVCNNSGGAIFHGYPNKTNIPSLDLHIAAQHSASVKEWALSRGFTYLSSNNKEEFDVVLPDFVQTESTSPIILEVFTDKEEDTEQINSFVRRFSTPTLKRTVASYIPTSMKEKIKRIIK